ncbi:hypothetical protein PRZ48_003649 [Zasmidium cellare]|uniref:Uncharacterized protein n=1 Tax=Zasmidium cellare TaxID=395010 RepID=A0ABR0EVM9_ZASCE|nr:hypothetical protein PRZ48_003649 [Zasmidium cellare]
MKKAWADGDVALHTGQCVETGLPVAAVVQQDIVDQMLNIAAMAARVASATVPKVLRPRTAPVVCRTAILIAVAFILAHAVLRQVQATVLVVQIMVTPHAEIGQMGTVARLRAFAVQTTPIVAPAVRGGDAGSPNGTVFLDPGLLTLPAPTIACIPPCTFVFPPWILPTPTTIQPPPTTITFEVQYTDVVTKSGQVTVTEMFSKTTTSTISFPPIITTEISIWEITWTDTKQSTLYLTSSIDVPPVMLTEGPDTVVPTGLQSSSTTALAGIIFTYSPDPYPPAGTQTTTPGPPPGTSKGSVAVTSGPPKPTCTTNCPKPCKHNCDHKPPCIGVCGCIGPLCGDFLGLPCPPGPPGGNGGGSSGGGGGGGGGGDNEPGESCEEGEDIELASSCDVVCVIQTASPTSTCTTYCETSTTCGTPSDTTTTTTIAGGMLLPTPNYDPLLFDQSDPELAAIVASAMSSEDSVDADTGTAPQTSPPPTGAPSCSYVSAKPNPSGNYPYCVCSSSTFLPAKNSASPSNSCAYTTKPTSTYNPTNEPPGAPPGFCTTYQLCNAPPTIPCTHYNADPDSGINTGYCVCSSSTYAESVNTATGTGPVNSCAYTTKPPASKTTNPVSSKVTTISSSCSVCTIQGLHESCTPLSGCTVSTSSTPTSLPTPVPCSGGLTLQLYSDNDCKTPLANDAGNICLKYNTCFSNLNIGWSSMSITSGSQALPNHEITGFSARNCPGSPSETWGDQTMLISGECLVPNFVMNSVGEGGLFGPA